MINYTCPKLNYYSFSMFSNEISWIPKTEIFIRIKDQLLNKTSMLA